MVYIGFKIYGQTKKRTHPKYITINLEFGTDLYSAEGLWYEKLDWFISRGYPVKRFLQRKDDIVVTGPGTLHWVRCFGLAMQTSWNIFPKNYEQFVATFDRHKINK